MRKAIELSFLNVREFSHCIDPVLKQIDTIHFLKPVNIGNILKFESIINYVDKKNGLIRVVVKAFTI